MFDYNFQLQVLRLWLERKILPEALLQHYIDDLGVLNDDKSSGHFLRRPSRAERAIDDPIREMEGMLVDEYGRSSIIVLPSFSLEFVFSFLLFSLFFSLHEVCSVILVP